MDAIRVDQIIQFALARAAHEDEWQLKELGPIHLIKYVYLADLAYARSHNGETFTAIRWVFFHFGPWSSEVFERIDQAAAAVAANVRTFESATGDRDGKRFSVSAGEAEALERKLDRMLPLEVTGAVKRAVHTFANDTNGLLHYVYKTPPMLRAEPKDTLDFTLVIRRPVVPVAPVPEISRRQEKKLEAAIVATRVAFAERLAKVKARTASPPKSPAPRYDEVFASGVKGLDADAEVESLSGDVVFPQDIWKSDWRDPHGGE